MRRLLFTLLAIFGLVIPSAHADPLSGFTRAWRDDPVWNDGQAEIAVYDASRVIYGKARTYEARMIINTEHASPVTFTKSSDPSGSGGRHVFKLHVRDDVPTENYVYHFSTMVYVGVADLKSLKLDVGAQEDCGASMKLIVNHAGKLTWRQYSYFPGEGYREGGYDAPAGLTFLDALPVVLRGYPFDEPVEMTLPMVGEQTTNKWSPVEPMEHRVVYVGRERVAVPLGEVEAHRLRVVGVGKPHELRRPVELWFAAEAALGHVLVKLEGPGQTYQLKSVDRRAYWE